MTTPLLRLAGLAVTGASLAALAAGSRVAPDGDQAGWMLWALPHIAVGALLTVRRPWLVIGWIFTGIGFMAATGLASDQLAIRGLTQAGPPGRLAVLAAWYGEWYWLPLLFALLVFLPLLFPDGRLPSPRWRPVALGIAIVLVAGVVLAALQERLDTPAGGVGVANPIGVEGLRDVEEGAAGVALLLFGLSSLTVALAAVITRLRSRRGTEYLQVKWFAYAALVTIGGFVLQGLADAAFGLRPVAVDVILLSLPPMTAALAILRYRLYDIDRIVSRTVAYALVSGLLVAVYAAAVVVLNALLPLGDDSPVAVAAATLAAAAAFNPLRRRVQTAVDRRFNRARYDAARTVEAFGTRLRDATDPDALTADLLAAVAQTVQPTRATLWLGVDGAGDAAHNETEAVTFPERPAATTRVP